jgi:hypothetical protein
VEYSNDRSTVRYHVGPNGPDTDTINLMVVNALDVHGTEGLMDKANIGTSDTTVASTVNKGGTGSDTGSRGGIGDNVGMSLSSRGWG